jgi:hypothetical protein
MIGDRVIVNFEETYGKGIFLGVEPKTQREKKDDPNSRMVQATDKETGLLRWTATLAVREQSFEKAKMENMAVTINSREQPYGAIPIGSYVVVERLEMGTMKQDRSGYSHYFSGKNIRQVAPERVVPSQSSQPVRVPSGQ